MENKFDAGELKNIVFKFLHDHNLMVDYKKHFDSIARYAMIVETPETGDKWKKIQSVTNLENAKASLMIAALDDERVPCSDLYNFSDEFNRYISRIWNHK